MCDFQHVNTFSKLVHLSNHIHFITNTYGQTSKILVQKKKSLKKLGRNLNKNGCMAAPTISWKILQPEAWDDTSPTETPK